jgi:epoxyqueuosine reductase QueG
LLVTPQAGPRVRWATVLTDAPLPACQALVENGCGDCQACVEICPVQAFTGRPFHPAEPRELRFDAHRCAKYFDELKAGGADPAVCGMCLYVCPYGKP